MIFRERCSVVFSRWSSVHQPTGRAPKKRLATAFFYVSVPFLILGPLLFVYVGSLFLDKQKSGAIVADGYIAIAIPLSIIAVGLLANFLSRKVLKNQEH